MEKLANKHLIAIEQLSTGEIELILETAQ